MHWVGRIDWSFVDSPGPTSSTVSGLARTRLIGAEQGAVHTDLVAVALLPDGWLAPHVHAFEEAIYVLEGEILVHTDGEEHKVGTGGVALFPRGVPHAFLVTSDTAHILAIATPGVGEPFYRDCSDPITTPEDADRPPDFARLRAAAARSDHIELLGPPPFDLD